MSDRHHIFGRCEPYICQYIAKHNLIGCRLFCHLTAILVLRNRTSPFCFLIFRICLIFGFCNNSETNWQRGVLTMVQSCHGVGSLCAPAPAMIVMPTDNVVFVCRGFFRNTVADNQGFRSDVPPVLQYATNQQKSSVRRTASG